MTHYLLLCVALAAAVGAADLPEIGLATAPWTCSPGVTLAAGEVSLQGDPLGYRRATLTLPAGACAGKTVRFSAKVLTQGIAPAREIAYASPKLKIINQATSAVMGVNNFGAQERSEWTPIVVEVTVPAGHADPVTLEIGLQFCSGLFKARDAVFAVVPPWRWRVLDGDQKSYFDK